MAADPADRACGPGPPLLRDKVVVVCGVGPGLGRAIALQSARAGADLVLAARTESRLKEVAGEVTALGRRAVTAVTDITDAAAAEVLPRVALAEFGRVDALVNNAFAIPPLTELGGADLDAVRAGLETNVIGTLRMTRLFTPALAESKGSVVMINSAVLRHSRLTFGPYKMAKSALLALAQSLATELGPQGIRVNTVAPGYIWAGSLKWYFGELARQRGVRTRQIYEETAATIDLRRLPEPDEIADAVVFLASPMARAITGQCLDVNCGEFHH
jgi:NAD(P)-dependent dehydrogenase (short-subunit alcohol dehydrogenase family)